jgi:predicted neuraminidase
VKLHQPNHTTRSNGIALSTGELLVPLHTRGTKAGGVMKSRDGGQTWTRFGSVANPEGQGGEPTIAETKSGKVHMILRTKDGQLWRSISTDKGETWSAAEKTGLTGTSSASHLLCTRDGTLVLTYNPGPTPLRFPLHLRTSRDVERAHTPRRSPRESRWLVHLLSHPDRTPRRNALRHLGPDQKLSRRAVW